MDVMPPTIVVQSHNLWLRYVTTHEIGIGTDVCHPDSRYNPDLKLGGVPVLQYLAHGDVDLKFDIPFKWNIDELSTFVAGWLANDHDAPRASMVGIMSSASLLSVISDLVGPELAQVFKALIYTSSLIFNSSNDQHTYSDQSTDIKILRHCGYRLLQHLDSQIRPTTLARLKKHELYAMFLLLLGCIISSKYVFESLGDLSRLTSGIVPNTTHQQVQPSIINPADANRGSELVRLLSHQMVYIGQTTGLIENGSETELIDDLTSLRWRKQAMFTWDVVPGSQNTVFSSESDLTSSMHQPCSHGQANYLLALPKQTTSSHPRKPYNQDGPHREDRNRITKRSQVGRMRQTSACVSCRMGHSSSSAQSLCQWCDTQNNRTFGSPQTAISSHHISTSVSTEMFRNSSGPPDLEPTSSVPNYDDNPMDVTGSTSDTLYSLIDRCMDMMDDRGKAYSNLFGIEQITESSSLPCDKNAIEPEEKAVIGPRFACTFHKLRTRDETTSLCNSRRHFMDVSQGRTTENVATARPPSPLDLNMGAFDPNLPTLGMEDSLFQDDAGFGFAFQSRIPTPPPVDMDFEIQQQLKEIGDQFQSFQGLKFPAAAIPGCFHDAVTGSTSLHNDLLGSSQRRLLL
jgi:hypothetical protein